MESNNDYAKALGKLLKAELIAKEIKIYIRSIKNILKADNEKEDFMSHFEKVKKRPSKTYIK